MADKKVRITEEVLSDYTGHMFGVPFINSVTVDPVNERRQARMLAALRGEVIGGDGGASVPAPATYESSQIVGQDFDISSMNPTKVVSGDETIAKYSNGKISFLKAGHVDVVVTRANGQIVTLSMDVTGGDSSNQTKVPINGIYMNPASIGMKVGESKTLSYNTSPDNATDKSGTWSTNNAAIVTVDQSGNITAVGVGNAVVTFTSNDGPSSTCQVAVTAA